MTASQQLLAEYVKNGSEACFQELVARYVDLVYSAALRLVDGDSHRARDVAQTVFVDFARMAPRLSPNSMLAVGCIGEPASWPGHSCAGSGVVKPVKGRPSK